MTNYPHMKPSTKAEREEAAGRAALRIASAIEAAMEPGGLETAARVAMRAIACSLLAAGMDGAARTLRKSIAADEGWDADVDWELRGRLATLGPLRLVVRLEGALVAIEVWCMRNETWRGTSTVHPGRVRSWEDIGDMVWSLLSQ